jgi:hypothetical protein
VNTVDSSANQASVACHTYEQGYATEIHTVSTPHHRSLEIPEGRGAFSSTNPISAFGGTAPTVYGTIARRGLGREYSLGEAGASWLRWKCDIS